MVSVRILVECLLIGMMPVRILVEWFLIGMMLVRILVECLFDVYYVSKNIKYRFDWDDFSKNVNYWPSIWLELC